MMKLGGLSSQSLASLKEALHGTSTIVGWMKTKN